MLAALKVVVLIPAYNEAPVIRGVVEGVRALGYRVLVCDDGSTDNTTLEAKAAGAEVIRSKVNRGVGYTLSLGVTYAEQMMGADVICCFDGDGQMNPDDIPTVIAALDHCDLASGSRFLGEVHGIPWHRRILLWGIRVAMNVLTGKDISDAVSGIKAFRAGTFRIRSERMAWAAELCYRVSRWGRVCEVPVTISYSEKTLAKGQKTRDALKVSVEFARVLMKGY